MWEGDALRQYLSKVRWLLLPLPPPRLLSMVYAVSSRRKRRQLTPSIARPQVDTLVAQLVEHVPDLRGISTRSKVSRYCQPLMEDMLH